MAKQAVARKSNAHKIKLTRAERASLIEQRLFQAAVKVVGTEGYPEATVSRITALAGVAQGTFYNYFETRQDLLDRLLPVVGERLLEFIQKKMVKGLNPLEREILRFKSFFDFLLEVPEFLRILVEAEIYAPIGYQQHIELVAGNYFKALRRDGVSKNRMSDDELEVVVHILLGARSYLCHKYSYTNGVVHTPPGSVIEAYRKLVQAQLFDEQAESSRAPVTGAPRKA